MEAGPESERGFPGMGLTRGHETQAMEALGLLFYFCLPPLEYRNYCWNDRGIR